MSIKIGLHVKDMKYTEETVYKIVGIDNRCDREVVILKILQIQKYQPKKIYVDKKTFWQRFQCVKILNNYR